MNLYKTKNATVKTAACFVLLKRDYIFLVVSFLVVSDIFILEESAILAESAALAESAILAESAAPVDDFDLQAVKETAIAKAKKPTLNEFFIVNFLK